MLSSHIQDNPIKYALCAGSIAIFSWTHIARLYKIKHLDKKDDELPFLVRFNPISLQIKLINMSNMHEWDSFVTHCKLLTIKIYDFLKPCELFNTARNLAYTTVSAVGSSIIQIENILEMSVNFAARMLCGLVFMSCCTLPIIPIMYVINNMILVTHNVFI